MHDRKARSLERWFQILTVLMGGGHPTADDLARRFGVTRRTIFRDIAALEKLRAGMPAAHQELAAGLDQTLVVDPLQGHSLPALPGVEDALRAGLQGPHPVRLRYQALAAAVLPATFVRPAGFDLERYLADIWGIEDGSSMQVRIRFSPPVARLARETLWHPTQRVEEEAGGSVILTMETRGKNELARWLCGYGGTVEVLDPPELREAVCALGRAMVERYGATGAGSAGAPPAAPLRSACPAD